MARVERHIFADTRAGPLPRRAVGARLLQSGLVSSDDVLRALSSHRREAGRLPEALRARGHVRECDILDVKARNWGIRVVDLAATLPDPRLIDAVGAMTCLRYGLVPWRQVGDVTVVALSRPEDFPPSAPDA
jgi:hypothetical protein